MALNVIENFYAKKSIKLSDAFTVFLRFKNDFIEYPSCVGFSIPKLEQDEDVMTYGNTSQTFLIPKYDSCKELSLTFYEYIINKNLIGEIYKLIDEYSTYTLSQVFSNEIGLSRNYGAYDEKFLPEIEIKIANNVLHRWIYHYNFKNLKIVNYNIPSFEVQGDAPWQITVNFSFESFEKGVINEEIWTTPKKKQNVPAKTTDTPQVNDPNGKVNVDGVNVNGQDISKDPEAIQSEWKESINNDDLHTMDNEPLLNPAVGLLPDLDDEDDITPEVQSEMWKQDVNKDDLQTLRNENELRRPELAELDALELDDEPITSNPNINSNTNGGDKTPDNSGPKSNPNPGSTGGQDASKAYEQAKSKDAPKEDPKPKLDSQPKEEKKTQKKQEKSYSPTMLAEQAAKYDISQETKQGQKGSFYSVGMNDMGTNANDRKEFDSAYTKYIKNNAPNK